MHVVEYIISTIAPHRCLSCGAEPLPLCRPCIASLPSAPECCYKCARPTQIGLCIDCQSQSHLRAITVRTVYHTTAEQILHQLKFERVKKAADCIAQSMVPYCPPGLITHVPTATKRIRQRGYDQAALIAKHLAHYAKQQYAPLLGRTGAQRQLGKDRQTRQQQLADAYYPLPSTSRIKKDTPIILLDDVLTTGSTLESAAAVLCEAGYANIRALAFAWVK